MRWAERFVNFIVHQRQPGSIYDCRERFVLEVAATRSACPWLVQEIQEAIGVVLRVAEPSELALLAPASSQNVTNPKRTAEGSSGKNASPPSAER